MRVAIPELSHLFDFLQAKDSSMSRYWYVKVSATGISAQIKHGRDTSLCFPKLTAGCRQKEEQKLQPSLDQK